MSGAGATVGDEPVVPEERGYSGCAEQQRRSELTLKPPPPPHFLAARHVAGHRDVTGDEKANAALEKKSYYRGASENAQTGIINQ
jgi:hypothetical protein